MASRPMPSVSGRRPTATRIRSVSSSVRDAPSRALDREVDAALRHLDARRVDGRGGVGLQAALPEDAGQLLADVGILERHDPVEVLDQVDLRAEVAVEAGPLDADRAGAHDRDPPRDRLAR